MRSRTYTDDLTRPDGIGLGPDRNLLIDPSWPGIYGNHSCDPNLWMQDAVTISTRRQVVPGEELTIDYAVFTATTQWSMSCRCRSQWCRGVVTGTDWRRRDLQVRYRGHFTPFITQMINQQVSYPDDHTADLQTRPRKAVHSVAGKVRAVTRQGLNLPLADLLGRLAPMLRGWTNYFKHGVSKATFDYLRRFTWRRVLLWIRRKHRPASWKWIRRPYLPSGGRGTAR